MPRTCPNCSRAVSDPGTGDPPAFCMYCGHRLAAAPDDSPTATFQPSDPDFADAATRSLVSAAAPAARPPAQIGGYRLVRSLGAGGMGAVFEAVAPDGETHVAVKLLGGKLAENPTSVERFKQEGRVASQIAHPRCVFVLGADTDAGRPYIVMELMPGSTLKDLVDDRGPLAPAEAVARILDVIDGLDEAHRLGVIHRDVKPSNCFLTADDRVKVGDFGLSKSLAGDREAAQLTQSGAFLGTVLFASPEQIRGEPVGYESDVYSACATLYYLLTGKAPHQHTSLTGALAKAISEPPALIRAQRPGVPASLERVVLRGLERDRTRRYQTIADLRDALRDQLPATHVPARRRSLILAYSADLILLQLAVIPFHLLSDPVSDASPFLDRWLIAAAAAAYFGTAEGIYGTTVGKQLLRLRVTKLGEIGPPGLRRGWLRTAVFNGLFFGTLTGFGAALDWKLPDGTRVVGLGLFGLCAAGLAVQLRRTPAGFRGLHDRATGCHTLQRPRPAERVRLAGRFPNPLGVRIESAVRLPEMVGGFTVHGKVGDLPDGGEVWVGEDKSLGRRVLLRLTAPRQALTCADEPIASRPTRLRPVGRGSLAWNGADQEWVAYVAPAGGPLADAIDPARPLGWADARPILEQLVDELLAANADGSAVERPGVGQVWVEPGGRLQLLDVPLPTGSAVGSEPVGPADPLAFVREVASLMMEGRPRGEAGRLKAPIPPHAAAVADKLFADGPDGYPDLVGLRKDLTETHAHPPKVSRPMRAAHLGVQAALLAPGLMWMFAWVALFSLWLAVAAATQVWAPERVRATVADPAKRAEALEMLRNHVGDDADKRAAVEAALAPERVGETVERLDRILIDWRANADTHREYLIGPERKLFDLFESKPFKDAWNPAPREWLLVLDRVRADDPAAQVKKMRWVMFLGVAGLILTVPAVWAAFAFAFRGGFAMTLAGIAVVRADGRRAGRFRCAVRELTAWLPITALLLLCLWVQTVFPNQAALRVGLFAAAVLLLPAYVFAALRRPAQPPHDRLLGTVLVPM